MAAPIACQRHNYLRMNVYCTEPPGSVVFTDPAAEDEGDLDSLPDTEEFACATLFAKERNELKIKHRQPKDRTRELVARLATLQSRA